MANPQKENGYTQIANEILEHLSLAGINGSEYRILLVVIRKTYGFQKKKDRISITQFEKSTLMNRPQAIDTIKSLLEKRILKKDNNQFVFNKNYEEWIVSKRGSMQKDTTLVPSMQKHTIASMQKHTKSSMQKGTYKRNKETITKERGLVTLKNTFTEFQNVKLTEDELQKLETKLGKNETLSLMDELGTYIASTGRRYSSHYATLLAWAKRKGTNYKSKKITVI